MLTHLDLFSGIGGFSIAAQRCGYTTVGFCEKEPYAQQIIKERFGAVLADAADNGCDRNDAPGEDARKESSYREQQRRGGDGGTAGRGCKPRLHGDIFTLNGADYAGVDLLTGGFPCQPFSVAGKRRGAADDRALWPEMLRVITEARPTWIIGENVGGIVSMVEFDSVPPVDGDGSAVGKAGDIFVRRGLGYLQQILASLESIGYDVQPFLIPACAVDARHRRDRVWIVAHAERDGRRADEQGRGQEGRTVAGRNGEDVADAAGGARQREAQGQAGHAEQRDQDVADADRARESQSSREREQRGRAFDGGEDVAHAENAECNGRRHRTGRRVESAGDIDGAGEEGALRWRPEPEMGRVADELPAGLDGGFCVFPAEPQDIPRVAHGIKHRAHRLRGLGNAIVVQLATEIIQAIRLTMETHSLL